MFEAFVSGLTQVLSFPAFGFMLLGMAIGWFVGILPGLGGATTLALMLPFVYTMTPVGAVAFLLGMYSVSATTGDITSVLFGVPGEVSSAATIIDGYPMTKKGQAGRALGAALGSSLVGALVGAVALGISIPVVQPLVLLLGSPEKFMLCLVAIACITAVSGRSLTKGFAAAAVGFMVSMVGVDKHAGIYRYTFDWLYLWDGISIITVALGLFAIPEIIDMAVSGTSVARTATGKITGVMQGLKDTASHLWLTVRCSLIGLWTGMVPGVGGGVSQWLAYAHAVQGVKDKSLVGHGAVEGVLGPGAANNSKEGGHLIPAVAFGVPGSAAMAILLGALMVVGVTPGPDMLGEHLNVTFAMVWTMVISNVICVAVTLPVLNQVAKISLVKVSRLIPYILMLVFLGAFAAKNHLGDLWMMLAFGAMAWIMGKLDWPRAPLILGVVLGGIAENNFWVSVESFDMGWLTRPGVLILFLLAVFVAVWPFWQKRREKGERVKQQETETVSGTHIAFTIFLALVLAWAVLSAKDWPLGARLFPWVVGIPSFFMALFQLARELRQWTARRKPAEVKGPITSSAEWRRTVTIGGWIAGFFAGIWLIGFVIALPLFVFLYMKLQSREKWLFSLLSAAAGWVFVYSLFINILHFSFPDPQILSWLGL